MVLLCLCASVAQSTELGANSVRISKQLVNRVQQYGPLQQWKENSDAVSEQGKSPVVQSIT